MSGDVIDDAPSSACGSEKPKVSVLVNNYNYAAYVGRAVASSLEQTHPSKEVVVVDDGSTDRSRSVLEPFRGTVRIILQENRGQAAAMNAAVRASRGDILCFLDSDDWWAPGKLAAVAAAFDADPRVVLVYHRLQPMRDDSAAGLKPIPRTLCSGDLSRRMLHSAGWWPFPMTSAIAVRRSAWDAAGEIPESFRISADAWLVGVYPFLGRVAALPASLGFYRLHGDNNWSREVDAAMLGRRMAHWAATVEATNRFLDARGAAGRLSLSDHWHYRLAEAELAGAGPGARLRLALEGLSFAGEPDPLRRLRDAVRVVRGPKAPAGRAPAARPS
jgi:glycosyltransferase involved in cell wall biosynthesis